MFTDGARSPAVIGDHNVLHWARVKKVTDMYMPGVDPGGWRGSWGSGPPTFGDPQTSQGGEKRCARGRECNAF